MKRSAREAVRIPSRSASRSPDAEFQRNCLMKNEWIRLSIGKARQRGGRESRPTQGRPPSGSDRPAPSCLCGRESWKNSVTIAYSIVSSRSRDFQQAFARVVAKWTDSFSSY